MLNNNVFVFPGQGSQYIGMGQDIYNEFQLIKDLFHEANDILGFNITKLMLEGDEEDLKQTENTQPALFLMSVAISYLIENLTGKKINKLCKYLAGHSLGEYSALCVSGAFSFSDGLKLVRKRGELMRDADLDKKGSMSAVIGITLDNLKNLLTEAGKQGIVVIANDNCDGQVVISGEKKAVDFASSKIKEYGGKMAISLPVSGAFHSPLMKDTAHKLYEYLSSIKINSPEVPVVSNVEVCEIRQVSQILDLLSKQVYSPVRWREIMLFFQDNRIANIYEIGSKNVLIGLAKRTVKNISTTSIEKIEDINNLAKIFS